MGCCGSVLALLLHSVTDFNLQIPANALVLAATLGLAYSAGTGVAPEQTGRPTPRSGEQ